MYEAFTLQLHLASKSRTNEGSAYPSQTNRFNVFCRVQPAATIKVASRSKRIRRLISFTLPSRWTRLDRVPFDRPVYHLAAHHGHDRLRLTYKVRIDREQILIKHGQVSDLADSQRALGLLSASADRRAHRVAR